MIWPLRSNWIPAIVGPLGGERIPRRWRSRINKEGVHDIWVIHRYVDRFTVWRWQINRVGQIRKASYPTVVTASIATARSVLPEGLTTLDCDAEPSLSILEIWY